MKTQEITIEESRDMAIVNIIAFNSDKSDRSYSLSTGHLINAIERYIQEEFTIGGAIIYDNGEPKDA